MSIIDLVKIIEEKEANQPHISQELICLSCQDRWIAVYSSKTLLKDLECECKIKGKIIATGQILE